jgi:hypothetical protein
MNTALRNFTRQYLGVVFLTLVPVVLTAFLSIPYTLRGHPGDDRSAMSTVSTHMT